METNNNYFITNMVERVTNGDNTLFLNQAELQKVIRILNKQKIKYEIFYPYPEAEKVIIYSSDKPKVILLEIKSKQELSHSEILGSLFGYNITPNNYGDIIIYNNHYYLIILDKFMNFFLTQFNKVGRNIVEVQKTSFELISDYRFEFDELRILCSSLRIDNVVAGITNLSRRSVDELFSVDDVLLNYETVRRFKTLEIGDILSIRKYGKYKFESIIGKNKKGNYVLSILKYK